MLLAIDPGNVESAWVLYDEENKNPTAYAKEENEVVLSKLAKFNKQTDTLILEMIASYGMSVGQTVFDTCVWIGRFWQAWEGNVELVYRKDVKITLCHSMKAKDSNIRQAIIDRYGGSKEVAVGKKSSPGPLYGMSRDMWSAFAVALTYCEKEDSPGFSGFNASETTKTLLQKIRDAKEK